MSYIFRESLLIIANRCCSQNVECPAHSIPYRKFQNYATHVLIRPAATFYINNLQLSTDHLEVATAMGEDQQLPIEF